MWRLSVLAVVFLVGSVCCFPEGRVVNGTATTVEKYPFIISLRSSSGSHSCGGSIIDRQWVMTAAHCVQGKIPAQISVQYATTTINQYGPNVAAVDKIVVHEEYSPAKSYANDIALLKMQSQFIYNYKNLAPVTLPVAGYETSQEEEGSPGTLAGWGLNGSNGYIQSDLQEVGLKVYSDKECSERHNGATSKDHICGGVDEGGKGQCSGDSGGPLMSKGMQVGIVSWSIKPCAVYPYPGVYTKVSHYASWISKILAENST